MRNYLFLLLAIFHIIVSCTKEPPHSERIDSNSALGRRQEMEENLDSKMKEHEVFPRRENSKGREQ